jgi:hypothetical protein
MRKFMALHRNVRVRIGLAFVHKHQYLCRSTAFLDSLLMTVPNKILRLEGGRSINDEYERGDDEQYLR